MSEWLCTPPTPEANNWTATAPGRGQPAQIGPFRARRRRIHHRSLRATSPCRLPHALNSPFGFRLYSHVGSDVPRERSTPVPLSRRILASARAGWARCISPRTFGLGRKLALKIVSARLAQDEDRLRRFQWEARSISALNHPNVITIYDIGEADGRHFIATEFIDGETLRARVNAGPLPTSARRRSRGAGGTRTRGRPRARHRPSRHQA